MAFLGEPPNDTTAIIESEKKKVTLELTDEQLLKIKEIIKDTV